MYKNEFKELGEFSKQFQLEEYQRVYSAYKLPPKEQKEIAIIGKSNVGKSTLINTLINHNIAKSSKHPGCTRWLGYIKLHNLTLIDIPGYGFSSVSKGRKAAWGEMIEKYIKSKRADFVLILIDSRRGMQLIDTQIAEYFQTEYAYIYTKFDKGNDLPLQENIFAFSAKTGVGVLELRKTLANI